MQDTDDSNEISGLSKAEFRSNDNPRANASTIVNEAQEGEGLGFSRATSLPAQSREPAKLDQPRLAFVKRHAKTA
ncbi:MULTISPECIES: hypothetical protein [unclassified Rhizobium]|uniref:hypothetical protein n=1 Tax=unclassified Rhizobium TaxID=2613769 RepID=UPI001ADCC738|nr:MULTISPECIES: hypothetical protein [unclassified Rhizobium]MBO9101700.1 hypothetical protein [Rhizobium sp. L58/93]MBO9170780.1 hypothetical protein [Rhizobium sp. L245/93]MBO9188173.1 hypothetical protein [Rhizobium sp. E27B/91]QXZ86117.1 hypothetical protein J5287_23785 [Rhizobium sp. K1/93]QXZ92427.1 hypothetical protein J5280_25405 [Rhizobium sp. K15/93]